MRALFHHLARLQHHDQVGIGDGGQAVRRSRSRCAPAPSRAAIPGCCVQYWVSSALVASSRIRIGGFFKSVRAMPTRCFFATRKLQTPFAHGGVVPLRQRHDEIVDLRRTRGVLDLVPSRAFAAVGNVVGDGVVEQHRVLRYHADGGVQAVLRDSRILPVDADRAAGDVIEAEQKPSDVDLPDPEGRPAPPSCPRPRTGRFLQDRTFRS